MRAAQPDLLSLLVLTQAIKGSHSVALLELVDASAGVYDLLLAGVEGMALGADINSKFLLGGAGLEGFTAYAANHGLAVIGMDVLLHLVHLSCTDLQSVQIGFVTCLAQAASDVVMQNVFYNNWQGKINGFMLFLREIFPRASGFGRKQLRPCVLAMARPVIFQEDGAAACSS